jgi:hypothetical protein
MLGGGKSCILSVWGGGEMNKVEQTEWKIQWSSSVGKFSYDSSGRNGSDMNLVMSVQNSTWMS